jgi:hypothetical protein
VRQAFDEMNDDHSQNEEQVVSLVSRCMRVRGI